MQPNNWVQTVQLRKYTTEDISFMETLYASTRAAELALTNFSLSEQQAFLRQQFNAQFLHYTQNYNSDTFYIIEVDGQAAGRLFIDHRDKEIRIVDISLLPRHRNKGLGKYLFNNLFNQAKAVNKLISIHVQQQNPARKLYEKLGFEYQSQTKDIYQLMHWYPSH